jgi:hypothetical protein
MKDRLAQSAAHSTHSEMIAEPKKKSVPLEIHKTECAGLVRRVSVTCMFQQASSPKPGACAITGSNRPK